MKKKVPDNNTQRVIDAIALVVADTGCRPQDVTVRQARDLVSDYCLKMVGGLNKVRNAYYPETEKDLGAISSFKEASSYVNKLENQLGKKEHLEQALIDIINNKLKPLPVPKNQQKKKTHKANRVREVVAMLNDTHYGLIVKADEVDGLNEFSWTEAARRTAFFVKEVNDYKPHARTETKKLHLVLNGDLINGIIHGLTSRTMELWVHQMNGALHIFRRWYNTSAFHRGG